MKSLSTTSPAETLAASQEHKETIQRVRQRSFRTSLVFWSFVGPLVLGLIVFFFIPIVWSIVLSFASARATITPTSFVGLQNYREMLGDPDFTKALATFTIFAVFIVPTTFVCALAWHCWSIASRSLRAFFALSSSCPPRAPMSLLLSSGK